MNILQKASNFAKSATAFVLAGMPCCDEKEIARRLRICADCPNFDLMAYSGAGECKVCGCNMEIKTVMETEECPEGKW
jgi:hypothetical protein